MRYRFFVLKHSIAVLAAISSVLLGGAPSIVALAQTSQPATSTVSSDATIRALQDALTKQGIVVKADGVLNDETRAAIRKYQSQHHLPVTGEPDKATLDKLGVPSRQGSTQSEQPVQAQATPSSPQQSQTQIQRSPQMPIQSGQGGMMMECPMMQGQSAQPPMMQNMMQMMQGMMQMMQMMQTQMQQMQQMHTQMHSGQMQMPGQMQQGQTQPGMMMPGQMQPGQMQPGQMRPGMMQPGQSQPGAR